MRWKLLQGVGFSIQRFLLVMLRDEIFDGRGRLAGFLLVLFLSDTHSQDLHPHLTALGDYSQGTHIAFVALDLGGCGRRGRSHDAVALGHAGDSLYLPTALVGIQRALRVLVNRLEHRGDVGSHVGAGFVLPTRNERLHVLGYRADAATHFLGDTAYRPALLEVHVRDAGAALGDFSLLRCPVMAVTVQFHSVQTVNSVISVITEIYEI